MKQVTLAKNHAHPSWRQHWRRLFALFAILAVSIGALLVGRSLTLHVRPIFEVETETVTFDLFYFKRNFRYLMAAGGQKRDCAQGQYWSGQPGCLFYSMLARDPFIDWVMRPAHALEIPADHLSLAGLEGKPTDPASEKSLRFVHNDQALRRREATALKKPDGITRIICIGGSVVYGFGVDQDQHFPHHLEERLNQSGDQRFEVINAGVPGYNIIDVYWYLRHYLQFFDPDLIIYGGGYNDFAEFGTRGYKIRPEYNRRENLSELLRNGVWKIRQALFVNRLGDPIEHNIARSDPGNYTPDIPVAQHEAYLEKMVRFCRDRGIRLLLMNFEIPRSVYRAARNRVAQRSGLPVLDVRDLVLVQDLADSRSLTEKHDVSDDLSSGQPHPPEDRLPEDHVRLLHRVVVPASQRFEKLTLTQNVIKDVYKLNNQKVWPREKHLLYDDGSHGDQKAGDGIYSRSMPVPRDRLVKFFYILDGATNRWKVEELGPKGKEYAQTARFVYTTRDYLGRFSVKTGSAGTYRLPIATFGRFNYLIEPVHLNAEGHRLLAGRLEPMIRQAILENPKGKHQ